MKLQIELNIPDERIFLNYWDYRGEDVICQLIDNKLMLEQFDENGDEISPIEITLIQFIEKIKQINQSNK